jgi:myo-inositol-1(or 4)-monophosphatase
MEEYKKFALEIARQAGDIIKKNFVFGMSKEIKNNNTPLTKTDLLVNTLLLEGVRKNFPDHNILGEEESDMSRISEYVWVCDPIDGTMLFSHSIPICVFSLALVKNGESILGVVYDPFQDRMFFAEKGKGAFLNGQQIFVSKADNFHGALATCEFFKPAPFDTSKLAVYLQMEKCIHISKFNSFIYSTVLVAAGELVFAIYPWIYAHDAAAAKIIVEEAGGKVTSILGTDQRYDREIEGLVVSNGILHDEVMKMIKEKVIRVG